ncbi:hypothetical protein FNYG_08795 [Fusarium nygamai]|uniref:Uncharacterized protein n=1 Tax=Gibberella nygamai TaxID=42673 RepID=A0A2K0W624_GIBNY|nr:hypothetical protein FNYG_08795 [Fusarium nygamai]
MLEAEHYRPKLFYTIHSDNPNLVGQEEPFPGPDNQSKMKHSVENGSRHRIRPRQTSRSPRVEHDEHVGQLTPTAGQYFSEDPFVDGGLAQGSTLSATASSFQPIGQRFKGKNALVFYPEGSPTVAGALSQDMDISVDTDHASRQPHTESPTCLVNIFPDTLEPPRFRRLNNIVDLNELIAGRDVRTTIMLRNIPNKDGQPPSAQVPGVSLSGGPVACFDSGWPELFGDLVVSRFAPRRKAAAVACMVAARRSMYGADMLPRTTEFGVTVEEARELHQKQKADDTGEGTAAQDAAIHKDGGIWDGTQIKNDLI